MTTSPKLARKRFAKFDRPSVAKMGTVLNSNVAPQISAQPSNFLVNSTTIRGRTRKLSRGANLQGESPVSNTSISASHRFARFVAFVPHSLICRACDCKASQIRPFFVEADLSLPWNEASSGMPVAWRHRGRVRRWPQMMTAHRHHSLNESRGSLAPDGCSGTLAPPKSPSARLKFRRDCGCFW